MSSFENNGGRSDLPHSSSEAVGSGSVNPFMEEKNVSSEPKQPEGNSVKNPKPQPQLGDGQLHISEGNFPNRTRNGKSMSADKDKGLPSRLLENDRIRGSPNRVMNYGSMERGRHRHPNFERRLSYGYGQQMLDEGRTTGYIEAKSVTQTGSLERDGNYKYSMNTQQVYSSVKQNMDYRQGMNRMKKEEVKQGSTNSIDNHSLYMTSLNSPNKTVSEGGTECRQSPSKMEPTNRTCYYSHVSRLGHSRNGSDGLASDPNIRRSSFGELPDKHLNYGCKLESQGKVPPFLESGKDKRRLSQPPPPFYHPPPPPGEYFFIVFSSLTF